MATVLLKRAAASASLARGCLAISAAGYRGTPVNLGVAFVPEKTVYVIEKFGRYTKTLSAGFHLLIPGFDKIAHVHSLKENIVPLMNQSVITQDNVVTGINAILYVQVVDAYCASYGAEDPYSAILELAQTTMRSVIGKKDLNYALTEREVLNNDIVSVLNSAAPDWGLKCNRFEIKDVLPSESVRLAMEKICSADRSKQASIIESEGRLAAMKNLATADATSIIERAKATAEGIKIISHVMHAKGTTEAANLVIAEMYFSAFSKLAKEGTTLLLPSDLSHPGRLVGEALKIFQQIDQGNSGNVPVLKQEETKSDVESD